MSEPRDIEPWRLFGFYFWKERAGVIGDKQCWLCCYGDWMHCRDSLLGLLWSLVTEFKHDRHLVG